MFRFPDKACHFNFCPTSLFENDLNITEIKLILTKWLRNLKVYWGKVYSNNKARI